MSDQDQFSGWAILELMGHRRLGGHLSIVEIAGGSFIRIDLASTYDGTEATQFYSPSAVYCITPTTEEIATGIGKEASMPVSRWELRALPTSTDETDQDILRGDCPSEEEMAF